MKVKGRNELEHKASFIFQELEREYRACEMVYIISELTKTMSLVMLQQETRQEASTI